LCAALDAQIAVRGAERKELARRQVDGITHVQHQRRPFQCSRNGL